MRKSSGARWNRRAFKMPQQWSFGPGGLLRIKPTVRVSGPSSGPRHRQHSDPANEGKETSWCRGARALQSAVPLEDQAMATSGDYRNYYERDGRRYSHTIDPRNGRPARHRLASVSVVAGDCLHADARATALMALGEVEGYRVAVEQGWAALLLIRVDGAERIEERATPAFEALLTRGGG